MFGIKKLYIKFLKHIIDGTLLVSISYLFLLSCGGKTLSHVSLDNIDHDRIISLKLSLGQGYNQFTNQGVQHCVNLGYLNFFNGHYEIHENDYHTKYQYIKDLSNLYLLRKILNIPKINYFLDTYDPNNISLNIFNEIKNKFESQKIKYRYEILEYYETLPIEVASYFEFKPEIINLFRNEKSINIQDFIQKCGTQFIYAQQKGRKIIAILEFINENKPNNIETITAQNLSETHALNDESVFKLNKIYTYALGFANTLSESNDLNKFYEEFLNLQHHKSQPVILNFITKDYSGVSPVDITLLNYDFTYQEEILEDLAIKKDKALSNLNYINYIMEKYSDKFLNPLIVEAYKNRTNQYIILLNVQALNCINDPFKGCKKFYVDPPLLPFN